MSSPAFEGDFIETHEGLIFDVKGFLHPSDRKIAYLRYIPISLLDNDLKFTNKRKRRIAISHIERKFKISIADIRFNQKPYVKVYDIPSRFKILSQIRPEYIFNTKLYDFPLQSVPNRDIKKIHKPEEFLIKFLDQGIDKSLYNLIEMLKKAGNISIDHIGLSGSPMVALEGNKSDYDIIIYGKKQSSKVHSYLHGKFSHVSHFTFKDSTIRSYNSLNLWKLYKIRASGRTISFKNFRNIEKEKTHQFLIDGKDVFIRYLEFTRSDSELPHFDNYSFKNLGRICVQGVIIDNSKSIFTPGSYYLKITKDLSEKPDFSEDIIEIFTLRGRFLEQARNGDTVEVSGKLEQTQEISMKKFSRRIVIGSDERDKMIQINNSKEKFN